MDRRQLAKNGLLGLVGALLGKLPDKPEPDILCVSYSVGADGVTSVRTRTVLPVSDADVWASEPQP